MLDEAGVQYSLRRYLEEPPDAAELAAVLDKLGLEPWEIARMGEPVAAELDLTNQARERDRWITLLVEHPELIQRPIIVTDDGEAWLARDPESVQAAVLHGDRGLP